LRNGYKQDMATPIPYRPGLEKNRELVDLLKEFQKNPNSLVFLPLAEAYREEGLIAQALEILEEGLVYHPELPGALLIRAKCFVRERRYADALGTVRFVLKKNADNIKALKLGAEVCLLLGQRAPAMRYLERVVTLFPQDQESARALEELENIEAKKKIPIQEIIRASSDFVAHSPGRIEDFQVSEMEESLKHLNSESQLDEFQEVEIGALTDQQEFASRTSMATPEYEPTFATRTVAELYLRQGLKAKAIRVIKKMLREDAANSWAIETLQDLESDGIVPTSKLVVEKSPLAPSVREKKSPKVATLERLLAKVRFLRAEAF